MKSEVLGVAYDGLTMDEAVGRALEMIQARRAAYICTPNPEIVWACRKDGALKAAVAGADMTLPDGVGVVWAARVLGRAVPERVSGYDFLLALLARFEGRAYLLGGRPGVAERAAETIKRRFPAVTVAGCRDGYYEDGGAVLEDIRRAEPDLILVCLGSPKQELWMAENKDRLSGGLMIGLGGSLDVLAGDVPRAPEGWRRRGLEWLYRLLREPKRLRRQMRLPMFALWVLWRRIKEGGS